MTGWPHFWETKFPEFPLSFPGYFKLFPWATQERKIDECIFVGNHVKYFSFSLGFRGFSYKSSNFPEFPWVPLSFPGFPCFPGLWPHWMITEMMACREQHNVYSFLDFLVIKSNERWWVRTYLCFGLRFCVLGENFFAMTTGVFNYQTQKSVYKNIT